MDEFRLLAVEMAYCHLVLSNVSTAIADPDRILELFQQKFDYVNLADQAGVGYSLVWEYYKN